MAESYEPLNPRNPFETPVAARTDVPTTGYDDVLGNLTDDGEQDRRLITDILGADIPSSSLLPMPQKASEGSPFKPDALEYKGVNWATPSADGTTRTFQNDPGFYNIDYDPEGKIGKTLGRTENEVLAANVFGRQFSRAELEKDSEGRKIIELMESRRSGESRSAGFLSGFTDWNLGNIPFLGWMMDVGSTVGDAVSMSQTMKKMQNGEAVTDHEALAVRRFMLQQEIDSERSTGYEVGTVIRSSLPFIAEMAASSVMVAGATKAGAAIGTFIGGPVGTAIGAAIGGVGGFVFGGGGKIISKLLGKGGAKVATNALGEFAERSIEKGFARGERAAILEAASKISGLAKKDLAKAAVAEGRANALEAMGREMLEKEGRDIAGMAPEAFREYALGHATKAEIAKRQGFESAKYLANSYRKAYDGAMDANLARFLMVDGDTSNVFHYGLNTAFEDRMLQLAGATRETKGFRKIIADKAAELAKDSKLVSTMDEVTKSFVNSAAAGAFGKQTGLEAIEASMTRSLGGTAAVNRGFTKEVMDVMAARAQKSFEMKYANRGFVNGMQRFLGFVEEGALDGALRWESSMFGGVGTLARDGTVLGGKINVLKEALRASFVEAPVRGALQLGSQAMMWPVVSVASGNGLDFTVRGQLSMQAQALQTGDRDLMDNARAIALGSGMVEYISENAGRGLNMVAAGVVKPLVGDKLLPVAVKEFGSHMAKKIDMIFGGEALMKEGVRKRVVDSIANQVGKLAAKGKEGAASVTRDEIDRFVTSRSFVEAPNLMRVLGKDAKTALTDAIREGADLTKREAAILYFTAFHMMDKGLTPQAMSTFLERVGYDGILSEMAEERYGGFFQGLFGLNDNPSDEGFRGRWKAAMEGLFPDRHQLVVEALGFAFPSVVQLSMNHLYSLIGQGPMSDLRNQMRAVNTMMSDEVRLTMPVESPEYAQRLGEFQRGADELRTKALGGTKEELTTRITAVAPTITQIAKTPGMFNENNQEFTSVENEEQAAQLLEEKANTIILNSVGSEEKLNQNLAKYEAEKLFGADGVEAIRSMWRQDPRNTDAEKERVLSADSEYGQYVSNPPVPEYRGPANVNAVVNELTASLPFRSDDASAIAESRARFSTASGVEVNQFQNDMASVVANAFEKIGDAYSKVELRLSKNLSWGRKALMRFTGIMNAVTTGDLSLAARNPVQWAMEEASVPKGLGALLTGMKRDSVMTGMRTVLGEMVGSGEMTQEQAKAIQDTDLSKVDGKLLDRFEEAGRQQYRETLYDFAHTYLAARNVLSVTNGDIEDAALRVVADKHKAADFRTDTFRKDHADEIVSAKQQIVGALAKMTATRAVSIDTHGQFGNVMTTDSVFDYERAMKYGTSAEIVAAIRTMPAFRSMNAVADVSNGGTMNPEAFGRVIGVEELTAIPTDRDLTPEELSKVVRAAGRNYGNRSEADNQRFAKTYIERLRIRMDSAEPASFVDTDGNELSGVTITYSRDPDTNVRTATVTYDGQSASAPTVREAASLLEGVVPVMPKLAIVQNDQLMSRDATSLALVLFGSRESARAAFEAAYPKARDESQFPPALRRGSDGQFQFSDEVAANMLTDELAAARSGNPVANDQVNGTGKVEDQYERGYESVMAGILEARFGVRRDHMSAAARTAAGGEAVYSARFNNFRIGDTTFVQSDYFTEGDAEAMVRCTLSNVLYRACTASGYTGMTTDEALDACMRADRDFVRAAKDLIAEYREKNPEKAVRIREALSSVSKDGAIEAFSITRVGAIAAASVVFSDERGMMTRGNGFLHGPELALIADRFRATSKWAPFLASLADEALGGNGFFTEVAASRGGFSRVLSAFAPSGEEVSNARANAIFTDSDDGSGKGPVKYVTYKAEPTVLTEDGKAIGVGFSVSEDNTWEFSSQNDVPSLTASVAASCHEIARAFKNATGKTMTSSDAYRVLRASEERETGSRASLGVYSDTGDRKPSAQRSAAVMADETAVGIGSNLRFLSSDFMAPAGGIAGRVAADRALPAVRGFLFRNGVNPANIDRVAGQLRNAFGAQASVSGGNAMETLEVSRADDEAEANAYMDALSDGEGNGDIFNMTKRMNAVIDNKDLMELGRQFQWVFPSEGANFTQVLVRTRSELGRLEKLAGTTTAVKRVSRYFSLLARVRTGAAVDAISYGTAVWNDARVTDAVLREAIRDLANAGQNRLAFVLNGIRSIPSEGKRRTTALALMGTLTPVDTNHVEMNPGKGTFGPISIRAQGSAGDVPVSSVRASIAHLVSKDVLGSYVASSISNMSSALRVGEDVPTHGKIGGREWSAAEIEAMLTPGKDDAKLSDAVLALKTQLRPTPESHDTVVTFARAFRDRMLRAADVCDYLFGADNEFAFALRNPEMVAYVVRDLERLMDPEVKEVTRSYIIEQYVQDFNRAGVEPGYRCRLVYDALVNPLRALANQAMNDRGDPMTQTLTSSTKLTVEELQRALDQKGYMDALLHSDLNASRDRTKWFPNAKDVKNRRVNSTLKRFLDRYVASAPRSVVRLNGQRSEDLEDTKRVTGVTASPAPMEQRCIDRMLSKLEYGDSTWKRQYLANGGRWDDGTRMIVATAGAKVGEELAEGRFLSPIVALANFGRFVSGDTRNVLFEVYHGEKPTVYSFNIPGTVCQQILDDIHAGKEYTKNPVTKEILGAEERPLPSGTGTWKLSPLTPSRARPTAKDQGKFNQLGGITKYVGFGGGSTGHYGATAFSAIANTGTYSSSDVVGVSVNGKAKDRVPLADKRYQDELAKVVASGATVIADTKEYRESFDYNVGEKELAEYLSSHGYREIEGKGIWVPKAMTRLPADSNVHVRVHEGEWTRDQVAADTDSVYLFGDNTNDRTVTRYVPSATQAVIRGLPNAIGIDTKKDRGTGESSFFTDADFDAFKKQVDSAIADARSRGKTIVIPAGGIGTGKAQLKERAPKLYSYLTGALRGLMSLSSKSALPKDINSKTGREDLYAALYSVVAANAGCDEMDTKRTQLLLSMGIPFAAHRDTRMVLKDGSVVEEKASDVKNSKGEPIVPGLFKDIMISGGTGASDLGMYLNTGLLVEAQRALSTNPDAVSFKNHLVDWFGSGLTKGQSHDFGIEMHPEDRKTNSGNIRAARARQRRRIERLLGLKDGILDLPAADATPTPEEAAEREAAVAAADAFLTYSTVMATDRETEKSGPFSKRCGFQPASPIEMELIGKKLRVVRDGNQMTVTTLDAEGNAAEETTVEVATDADAGQALPFFDVLPGVMKALGLKELTEEDISGKDGKGGLVSTFVRANGTTFTGRLADAGIFHNLNGNSGKGDRLSIEDTGDGFVFHAFTRAYSGQIVANSDASSEPSLEHPAATNWDRDLVANEGRLLADGLIDRPEASVAISIARVLPYAVLKGQPNALIDRIRRTDPELYANWMAHPNSDDVQSQLSRKLNSLYAKSMRPYVNSTHAVLMGSGLQVTSVDPVTGVPTYAKSSGVTDYDAGCFRECHVLTEAEKAAFGVGRALGSGNVNISDPAFRYGWHLRPEAFDEAMVARIDKAIERYSDRLTKYNRQLSDAYGLRDVDTTPEMLMVARLATLITAASEARRPEDRKAFTDILGTLFTDYTGKTLAENRACDLAKVSFGDLFLRDGSFDLSAFDFLPEWQRPISQENMAKGIYLGGSVFAGDRRPSGNYEAAMGLFRAQDPVDFEADGTVGSSALYQLPPLVNKTQGSDTDGDSATGTVFWGSGPSVTDKQFLDYCRQVLPGFVDRALKSGLADIDSSFAFADIEEKFPEYFETDKDGLVVPSERFNRAIANRLLQCELDSFRLMPNEEQGQHISGYIRDINETIGTRRPDYGLVGRKPVGTDAVSAEKKILLSGRAADLYRLITGKEPTAELTYDKAFKECVNAITGKPSVDMLRWRTAAGLSGSAADANEARGVGVSVQATLGHLFGYAATDPQIAELCPGLFRRRTGYDGKATYRPAEDFCSHQDGIANALFDVVKDLFAPRAGWKKDLVSYMTAKLVYDANEEYLAWEKAQRDNGVAGEEPHFDDEWFFVKLVEFARDFSKSEESVPWLLDRIGAFDNFGATDRLTGQKTFLGKFEEVRASKELAFADFTLGYVVDRNGRPTVKTSMKGKRYLPTMASKKAVKEGVGFEGAKSIGSVKSLIRSMADALRADYADLSTLDDTVPEGEDPETYVTERAAYEEALELGWRPTYMMLAGKWDVSLEQAKDTCSRIADVLSGVVRDENRNAHKVETMNQDELTAIACSLLFEADAEGALPYAEDSLKALDLFSRIRKAEAGFSPDTALRTGGTKAARAAAKNAEYMAEFGAQMSDEARFAYGAAQLRLNDEASEQYTPVADAKRMSADARNLSEMELNGADDADFTKWADGASIRPPETKTDAEAFMHASALADSVTVGVAEENLANMRHIVGAVELGLEELGKDAFVELVETKYRRVADLVSLMTDSVTLKVVENGVIREEVVPGSIVTGDYTTETGVSIGADAVSLLNRIRSVSQANEKGDTTGGRLDLVGKFRQEDIESMRNGFRQLKAIDDGVVQDTDGRIITGRELSVLIRLNIAASFRFDPVTESALRTNVSEMFGTEVDEMERWGSLVTHDMALRQLCLVPRTTVGTRDAYDLLAAPVEEEPAVSREWLRKATGTIVPKFEKGITKMANPLRIMTELLSDGDSALVKAYRSTTEADPSFLPVAEQPRPVVSDFSGERPWHLRPATKVEGVRFVGANGERFNTVEEAANSRIDARIADLKAMKDADGAAWLAKARLAVAQMDGPRTTAVFSDSSSEFPITQNRNVWSVENAIDDTIAETADADSAFDEELRNAALDGGRFDGTSNRLVRRRIESFLRNRVFTVGRSRASLTAPSVAPGADLAVRMERGGFFEYLKGLNPENAERFVANPYENVKKALEKAFGKWSAKTGVKVERVTRNGLPLDLLKVTRKVRDTKGTHHVTTYMSFGDVIPLDVKTTAYNEGILEIINSRRRANGLAELPYSEFAKLSDAERIALANAAGAVVKGDSTPLKGVLGTDALLAVTGLVRLSERSDYRTLFHEYFHQMLDFYRRVGVCTAKDEAELVRRFSPDGKIFNEEAAADAFAAYVTGMSETEAAGKLLADGASGDDRIFKKFHHTAKALLAGTMAYNSRGVPVFMKMMISADFSEREMKTLEEAEESRLADLENELLGKEGTFGFPRNWTEAEGPVAEAKDIARMALAAYGRGETEFSALKGALGNLVTAENENPVQFEARLPGFDTKPEAEPVPDTRDPMTKYLTDRTVPANVRVRRIFSEALNRVENGTAVTESREELEAFQLCANAGLNEVAATDLEKTVSVARRAVLQTCDALGIVARNPDGTPNELGSLLFSDEEVSKFALRLVHAFSTVRTRENDYVLDESVVANGGIDTPAQFASADFVVGRVLTTVVPQQWGVYARQQAAEAARLFQQAADRASAMAKATGEQKYENYATMAAARAADVERFADAVARGEDLHRLLPQLLGAPKTPRGPGQGTANLYGWAFKYITNSAVPVQRSDGTTRYEAAEGSVASLDYGDPNVQNAIYASARAFGIANVVRKWAKENGVELPAVGEPVMIPADAVEPPAEGTLEPDTSPQVILQTQSSWLASDLSKRVFGHDLRDTLTDVSIQAAAERTNRIANKIDFYIGANVLGEGDRVNEIEEVRSDLVVEGGMPLAGTGRGALATKVAGVRAVDPLGVVNRSAKTAGEAYTKDWINLTHWVGQTIGAMANGDPLYTGYDIPWTSRKSLDAFLARLNKRTTAAAAGDVFSAEQLADRVSGKAKAAGRTDNLDLFLSRIVQGIPAEILGKTDKGYDPHGLYCQILDQIAYVARTRTDGVTMGSADFHDRLVRLLTDKGLCSTYRGGGRSVLVIPTAVVERVWNASAVKKNLIDNCGRKEGMLSLRYLADLLAAEANRLNGVAAKSKFLSGEFGSVLSGTATPGIWFEGGTGHHQLFVDRFVNAREAFRGEPSPEEQLRSRFEAFQETLEPHAKEVNGVVKGELPAFAQDKDGNFTNVSDRQLGYLARLLGLGRVTNVKDFGQGILNGRYRSSNPENMTGFDIRPDMTLFEFDRLVFEAQAANLVMEANGEESFLRGPDGKAPTRQELVDAYEFNRRLQAKLMADGDRSASGKVCSMSEKAMFERFGRLGSAKTGTERLRSMAESIVHAERFRGCLAQMLCSVGTDGSLNYIVSPNDAAAGLAPDAYWMALARFTADRLGDRIAFKYNEGLSGIENMRNVAAAARLAIGKGGNARMRYHMLPPNELGAEYVFGEIWCLDDLGGEDVLNRMTNRGFQGSAAAGYMRQLFAITESPSVWNGFRKLDRLMSYSKAASVGLSGFFAFATRFESPVAACGFWNTAMGYTKMTSKLARRLADTKLGQMAGFRENLPYLADFVESVTSDDPAIQYMRELCDMIGMPLTDSVMNPLTGKMGGIDADIAKISKWLEREGHGAVAKEVRTFMKAALHNPSEYAFSNILNCVKMAVVAQTMYRLREECEAGNRPFDPIRELRKHSAYINAEIGGIQPEQYAWLTPGMQQLLRLTMFSYQWTLGAWTAGSGGIVTDLLFGGHSTTAESRKFAFVRWMRMLGVIKVGVPVFMQMVIRLLATAMTKFGWVGDPDEKDPLGIENMPWWCFFNESKIGPLAFDITPLLKLAERVPGVHDIRARKGYWPAITTAAGTIGGFFLGGKTVWGTLLGAGAGAMVPNLLPGWEGVGRGANTTGRRRSYMHFAKQSDEFWRWFTDAQSQLASKLSIPLQKALEALGISGSQFDRKYEDMSMAERFINLSVDPSENALVNLLTGFAPFSFASVAGHADAGLIGMIGPVNYGLSKTAAQKQIVARLREFAMDDSKVDIWASKRNRKQLGMIIKDIAKEAKLNGIDPKQLLDSALGEVSTDLYRKLFNTLPKTKDDGIDAKRAGEILRALNRLNRKHSSMMQSLKKKYEAAGVDWKAQPNAPLRAAVREFLGASRADPWLNQGATDEITERYFDQGSEPALRSTDVQQDAKGGEDFANFLATDKVPDTIFGIPVVSRKEDYTEEDTAFFKANPRAGGYYSMGDEGGPEEPPEGPEPSEPPENGGPSGTSGTPDEPGVPVQADTGGGNADEIARRVEEGISKAIPFIKEHEGFRDKAYQDSVGKWTIGYGQTEMDGRAVKEGDVIDEPAAAKFVERRVRDNAADMYKNMSWTSLASPNALAALYDVAYNAGVNELYEDRSLGLATDANAAVDQTGVDAAIWKHIPTYRTTGGKVVKGLVNRRNDAIKKWK